MRAAAIVRLAIVAGPLVVLGGCDLLLGLPDLGDPGTKAAMTDRFKATVQSQLADPAPLDWGPADSRIWRHFMGPRSVAYCGRPAGAPRPRRAYQVNFFRGSLGGIGMIASDTPAHPSPDPAFDSCEPHSDGRPGPSDP